MAVTIKDVANLARVSPGTASRALRGHPQLSPACVARVRAAARQLGYTALRDRSGRASLRPLAGRRIAILMLGLDRALASLPSVAEAIHGAEAGLAEAGADPVLVNAFDPAEPPKSLRREKFDGIIAKAALQGDIGQAIAPRLLGTLRETPLVWMLGRPPGCGGDAVDADDEQVGRMAALAVLEHGHRHVAVINPKSDHAVFSIRHLAFRRTIEHAGGSVQACLPRAPRGVTFPLQPVADVSVVQPLVDEAIAALVPRSGRGAATGPTAIFCPADGIAALVYRALATRGLMPGRDISIVSCNNDRGLVAGLWPPLATVDIHADRVGRLAVGQLASRLKGEFAATSVRIAISPSFLPGGSLARCPRPTSRPRGGGRPATTGLRT